MRKNKKTLKNYGRYQFSFIEKLVLCVASIVIALCVAYLFFDNLYAAAVFFFPVCIIAAAYYRKMSIAKTKRKLCSQFEELMNSLSESLRAGYSLENAFFEAGKQLRVIYDKADILDEIYEGDFEGAAEDADELYVTDEAAEDEETVPEEMEAEETEEEASEEE